jgi:integrase
VFVLRSGISSLWCLLKASAVQCIVRRWCPLFTCHSGQDPISAIRYIQQLLGHDELETTAIYTELSIAQLVAIDAKLHPAG